MSSHAHHKRLTQVHNTERMHTTPNKINISNNWAPHTCPYRVMNTHANMCHTYSMHAPQIMNTLTMKHIFHRDMQSNHHCMFHKYSAHV